MICLPSPKECHFGQLLVPKKLLPPQVLMPCLGNGGTCTCCLCALLFFEGIGVVAQDVVYNGVGRVLRLHSPAAGQLEPLFPFLWTESKQPQARVVRLFVEGFCGQDVLRYRQATAPDSDSHVCKVLCCIAFLLQVVLVGGWQVPRNGGVAIWFHPALMQVDSGLPAVHFYRGSSVHHGDLLTNVRPR